jgi:hypothetical protein
MANETDTTTGGTDTTNGPTASTGKDPEVPVVST